MLRTYEGIYNKILPVMQQIEESEGTTKAGRKPKISSAQISALFVISYITNTPILTLAQFLIDHKLKSYHIFRGTRIRDKRIKLVVDATSLPVASLSKARIQRIRRFAIKAFWGKRKRKLYSHHYWFYLASMNEVNSLKLRVKKSLWLSELLSRFELIGDKGYRYSEYVKVCESKEDRGQRQAIEGVFSWLKKFNLLSGWRKGIRLLTYLHAYALGHSFFRKKDILACA